MQVKANEQLKRRTNTYNEETLQFHNHFVLLTMPEITGGLYEPANQNSVLIECVLTVLKYEGNNRNKTKRGRK